MRNNYCKLLTTTLLLTCFGSVQAQTKLSGEIVDKTNAPVPGVLVNFNNGKLNTVSNDAGKFTLSYPDTLKSRSIVLHAFGYKSKKMIINKGQEYVKVVLIDSSYNLQAVTVSASKHGRFSDYSAQTLQMSSFDIVTNPSAMADIIGNMRVLPGVQTNDNDGRLIVQGGSPDESQIYINELIVANPYNLSSKNSGVRSRFSSDLFEGIALQSGGFNAEFGQALSGIVNLNTKEKERIDAKTDISISSVFAGLTHLAQKSSYAYRASVDYTNIGPYTRLFPDAYEWSKYYQQMAGDFFLAKTFSPKTKMTAQANFSIAGGEYSYENVDSIRIGNGLKETYFYAQVNLYHAFTNKLSLSVAGNVVVDNFTGTETIVQEKKVNKRTIWNHNKINLQYRSGRLTNRTGVEFICNPFDETYTLQQSYNINLQNNLWSLYNDTKVFLTENLTASVGLRGEYSTYLKQFNLAPRIYLAYRLNRENILSASVGEYFQLPSMNYLQYSDGLDFTSAKKATISYSYVKRSDKFQIDAYYKKYNNAVTYSQGALMPESMANNGQGDGWGADVFWKSHFKMLEYWLTYSYNNTQKQYDYYTKKIAPDYLSNHVFNITLKYWLSPLKSLLGMSYNIASGAPYYSDTAPYAQLGTTPFRNRLDVSWSFLPKDGFIIHFGCQNVLGYKNVYGYEYSKITTGLRQEISNPDKRFLFLGIFITISQNKKLNQLKNL